MTTTTRIEMLDWARGVALIAMTIFHFAFDLELFGFLEQGFISQPHWKYFARAIASSFLFLAGFSLFLAHHQGIRWSSWRWRMLKIGGAACLITVATWFATPGQYIFFGILHAIAFASLAGLLFMRLPALVTLVCAVIVFVIGQTYETSVLGHWAFWWTGLSQAAINSSDYVPVFPWFSAPLAGVAVAKLAIQRGWLATLSGPQLRSPVSALLKFIGRNSLVYYLVHQPVMIAGILSIAYLTGNLAV